MDADELISQVTDIFRIAKSVEDAREIFNLIVKNISDKSEPPKTEPPKKKRAKRKKTVVVKKEVADKKVNTTKKHKSEEPGLKKHKSEKSGLKRRKSEEPGPTIDIVQVSNVVSDSIDMNKSHERKSKSSDPESRGIHNMIMAIRKWKEKTPEERKEKHWICIMEYLYKNSICESSANLSRELGIPENIVRRTIKSNGDCWDDRSSRNWIMKVVDEDDDDTMVSVYNIRPHIAKNKEFRTACKSSFGK